MSAGQVNCLVTGATGYIGARLVPLLLDEGHRVRALARDPNKLADAPWRERAELARGDLGDVDSLITAFNGIDVLYHLVHSMGTATDFAAEEARAVRNVVTAARHAGVRRLVYLGGLHPEGRKLSPHLESRRAVGEALIESGIETLILQAAVVVGSGSASFEMIRHLTDRLPVMTTPKWVHNRIQPIAVHDALYYLVAAATVALPCSRTWDIGGPDVLEYGDMMRIYAEVAGLHQRRLVVLPFLTPRIASLWVGTVTPIPSGLARPLIESLECDAVMRNSDIDAIVAPPPGGLTGYRQAVELALERAARGRPAATWDSLHCEPADLLPSDPKWAGEVVYSDVRTAATTAAPEDIWTSTQDAVNGSRWYSFILAPGRRRSGRRWSPADRKPTTLQLAAANRLPGPAWLEITVTPGGTDCSRYTQRAIVYPRGVPGRLYWAMLRPLYTAALRALAHDVIASAG